MVERMHDQRNVLKLRRQDWSQSLYLVVRRVVQNELQLPFTSDTLGGGGGGDLGTWPNFCFAILHVCVMP